MFRKQLAVLGATLTAGLAMAGIATATVASSRSSGVAAPAASAPHAVAHAGRICSFYSKGDHVHPSFNEVSGHGWWTNIDCNSDRAVVTVQLEERKSRFRRWQATGTPGVKTVPSTQTGGRGNRATARAYCSNDKRTQWRSVIYVEIEGIPTQPNQQPTPPQWWDCRA